MLGAPTRGWQASFLPSHAWLHHTNHAEGQLEPPKADKAGWAPVRTSASQEAIKGAPSQEMAGEQKRLP